MLSGQFYASSTTGGSRLTAIPTDSPRSFCLRGAPSMGRGLPPFIPASIHCARGCRRFASQRSLLRSWEQCSFLRSLCYLVSRSTRRITNLLQPKAQCRCCSNLVLGSPYVSTSARHHAFPPGSD